MIKKVKLGDKIEFQRGYDLTHANMNGGLYPVVGSTNVIGYHNDYKSENGITLGRSGTVGFPQLIRGKFWPHNTTLFSTDLKGNNLEYLYYLLVNLHIDKRQTGSVVPTLNRNDIYPLIVPFEEDIKNQILIAKALSLIDSKIENNISICSSLESMAKLLYDYWFVQFDFPDENGKPYKSSGGKMVWNEELKREIPEGWSVNKLGSLINYTRGISYTGSDMCEEGTPIISLASIDRLGRYIPEGIKYFNQDYPESKILKPYDLVMANTDMTQERAVMGKIIFVPDIFSGDVLSTHHITKIMISDDLKSYLMMTTQTDWFHKYIKGFSSGTNVLGMDMVGFENFMLLCPSKEVLFRFNHIIYTLYAKVFEVYKENFELDSLRDFLLPMLMNGQVKVG